MKRGFIRALYGIFDNSNRILSQRFRISKDIDNIRGNLNNEPFVTYVFGEDNYKELTNKGFNCVLIDKNPQVFDLVKHCHRHKLEAIRYAMENDGYDEIVLLDWDCVPLKKIPSSFWNDLGRKEVFQACLQAYRRPKCLWRSRDRVIVPNGGFVYIRDRSIPEKVIKAWNIVGQPDNEEIAYAKVVDEMTSGWIGVDKYCERFEPIFCNLHKNSPVSQEVLKSKDVCFMHYHG